MIQVIGIGNPHRGDDAAGLEVAARLRAAGVADVAGAACDTGPPGVSVTEFEGDQIRLLDTWDTSDRDATVILIDATCSGAAPGTVTRFDASGGLAHQFTHRGTHSFSLADVVELARVLGRLPRRLSGYGIEGASFGIGEPLSPEAEAAVGEVTARLLDELQDAGPGRDNRALP